MSGSLNVIALISGGKDSLYSILHCQNAGHNVVALANLYPTTAEKHGEGHSKDGEIDDIDSFMYQTIGHQIIPLYRDALGLPLYRRAIYGTALQTQRDYGNPTTSSHALDETEDLVPLLKEVLKYHPEANAVCTGAILSSYQRTRVESVAIRLGLIPLSYLWQYPFLPVERGNSDSVTGLLDDMAAAGCEAKIIKIASGGLDDEALWADICSPRTRAKLVRSMQRFTMDDPDSLKAAVLGEGGEFETLALKGPPPTWKMRIKVDDATITKVRGEGGASFLKLGCATLEPIDETDLTSNLQLRRPALFEPTLSSLAVSLSNEALSEAVPHHEVSEQTVPKPFSRPDIVVTQSLSTVTLANIQLLLSVTDAELRASIIKTLHSSIGFPDHQTETSHDPLSSVVFAVLLVRDMASFPHVNSLWTSLFSSWPNPPARVTISCGELLPENVDFSVSVVIDRGDRSVREGLHVQSWSYWAPANIGPYSQSVVVPFISRVSAGAQGGQDEQLYDGSIAYIAGQIPLTPSTMRLHSGCFSENALLSLQHLWRIGIVQQVDWWLFGIAFLEKCSGSEAAKRAIVAHKAWKFINEQYCIDVLPDDADDEETGPDAWDLKYGNFQGHSYNGSPGRTSSSTSHRIPNPNVVDATLAAPPFIAAEVCSLPRDAPIEWQALGVRNLKPSFSIYNISVEPWGDITLHVTTLSSSHGLKDVDPQAVMQTYITTVSMPSRSLRVNLVDSVFLQSVKNTLIKALSRMRIIASQEGLQLAGTTVYSVLPKLPEYLPQDILRDGLIVPCFSVRSYVSPHDAQEALRDPAAERTWDMLLALITRAER